MDTPRAPRQNRVNPFGTIFACPDRGMFMGNRGILHDEHGRITVRPNTNHVPWKTKAWIICLLEFKGRRRRLMLPGHYTELFFLDEATALAAGHRPCAECRHADYNRFKSLWQQINGDLSIDRTLHAERTDRLGGKVTYRAAIDSLPDGAFVTIDGMAWLIWRGSLLRWSSGGYDQRVPRPSGITVDVLTPRSTVAVLRLGYAPVVHPSADELIQQQP